MRLPRSRHDEAIPPKRSSESPCETYRLGRRYSTLMTSVKESEMKRLRIVACICSLLAVPGVVWAQTEDHAQHKAAASDVGTVTFETSCNPAVKDALNHAVAELHSFWFPEA